MLCIRGRTAAAQQDQLHAGPVDEDVRDVEGVGDHA
jgi:hypothetical protein